MEWTPHWSPWASSDTVSCTFSYYTWHFIIFTIFTITASIFSYLLSVSFWTHTRTELWTRTTLNRRPTSVRKSKEQRAIDPRVRAWLVQQESSGETRIFDLLPRDGKFCSVSSRMTWGMEVRLSNVPWPEAWR